MELFGYIKANKLASEYILRQDMPERKEVAKIAKEAYKTRKFDIANPRETKKVIVKNIYTINDGNIYFKQEEEEIQAEYESWIELSNKSLEKESNILLGDYKSRTELINTIVNTVIINNSSGISINFEDIDNNNMIRFMIELAPKLREIGITTCIVLNGNMNEQDYINVVDYIVE